MASVDFNERQLTLKLVYYGPARSGKTTNLQCIHSCVKADNRGRLLVFDTRDDRTLFFDLLPIFFKDSGLSFRVKVYTVPGQPMHEATRRVVLSGADGVVFVADATPSEQDANAESYATMLENLQLVGLSRDQVPIVVQYNKMDLPNRLPESQMCGFKDNLRAAVVKAAAIEGRGVTQTLFALLEEVWRTLDARLQIERGFAIGVDAFMAAVRARLNG